jgi:hypothetical protein
VIVYESGYHYKITDFLTLIGGMTMSRGNTRSLLLGGLVATAYMYLQKPENRDKAKVMMNNTMTKVSSF